MSLPKATVSNEDELRKVSFCTISRKLTVARFSLGISTPTVSVPGMGAWMRTATALSDMARSGAREAMRLALTPGSGRTSNMVTTGPGVTLASLACTPKF